MKGIGWADGSACPALKTFFFISPDILPNALHLDAQTLKVSNPLLEVLSMATQFHDHETLFSRVDRGFKDVKGEIKSLNQVHDDRFIDDLFRKPEGKGFCIHNVHLEIYETLCQLTFLKNCLVLAMGASFQGLNHSLRKFLHSPLKPRQCLLDDLVLHAVCDSEMPGSAKAATRDC